MMTMQLDNFINFLIYFGVSLPLLGIGIYCFMLTTRYNEYALMAEGADGDDPRKAAAAQATAYDIGGKVLGLGIVLASAIFHAANILDMIIWALLGIVFQILVFYLYDRITPFSNLEEIPKGNVSVGILSAFISTTTGIIMAALIS
jgi:putative membrane protein